MIESYLMKKLWSFSPRHHLGDKAAEMPDRNAYEVLSLSPGYQYLPRSVLEFGAYLLYLLAAWSLSTPLLAFHCLFQHRPSLAISLYLLGAHLLYLLAA